MVKSASLSDQKSLPTSRVAHNEAILATELQSSTADWISLQTGMLCFADWRVCTRVSRLALS